MVGRILIADDTATGRIRLKVDLAEARYVTQVAPAPGAVLALARRERPDLVLLGGGGLAHCAALRADPATRSIPVVVLDGAPSRATRLAALAAGADEVLAKPYAAPALLAVVRTLLRRHATQDELARRQDSAADLGFAEPRQGFLRRARVALVAPTPETGLRWKRGLGVTLTHDVACRSRGELLGAATGAAPDAVVIAADLDAPGTGLRLISDLRSRMATRRAVIVVIDSADDPATVPMALDVGADAVLGGSFDAEELALRLEALIGQKRQADALRDGLEARLNLALIDPLTGLYNRRYAETHLARIAEDARATGQPFALMLLDLDLFKRVNDLHGHMAGDAVLAETARRLRANLREVDLLARYGGEEFVIAMPTTDLASARIAADRLRRVIGERPFQTGAQGEAVAVTVSIGVQVCDGPNCAAPALDAMMRAADAALYSSKASGRNLVTFARGKAA
jgi:two-component system cell cycle response regulator